MNGVSPGRKTMKRRILIAAASAAVLLLSILVWRAVSDHQDIAQTPVSSEAAPVRSNLKSPENQTPKSDSEMTESAAETGSSADSAAETTDTGPYNFKTKEEAYQVFLQLFATEYDRLVAEGREEPSLDARAAAFSHLRDAMRPFFPRRGEDGNYIEDDTRFAPRWSSPGRLAVDAGKLPETSLYGKAVLPQRRGALPRRL